MGAECPICGEHGAYVAAITATGEPALKGKDIIARKLSCGHVVGNEDYMEYREKLASIEKEGYAKKAAIDADIKRKKTALWSTVMKPERGN